MNKTRAALMIFLLTAVCCGAAFAQARPADPEGHQWWIAQVIREVSKEEMEREAAKQMGKR